MLRVYLRLIYPSLFWRRQKIYLEVYVKIVIRTMYIYQLIGEYFDELKQYEPDFE